MSTEMTMAMMMLITVGAAVYVAWPLLVGGTDAQEYFGSEPAEPVLQQLMFQRDTTYAAMKELDFDLAMGNLSKEDFQQLQERYKRKAVALLKRIDDVKAGRLPARQALEGMDVEMDPQSTPRRTVAPREPRVDLDVEQEIEAYRRQSRSQQTERGATSSRTPAAPLGAARPNVCPSCGRPIKDPEAAFCARCGAPIRPSTGRRRRRSTPVKGDDNGTHR